MMNKISSCLKWTWSGGPSPGLCHATMTEVAPPVASVARSTCMSRPKGLIDNACLGVTTAGCSGVRACMDVVSGSSQPFSSKRLASAEPQPCLRVSFAPSAQSSPSRAPPRCSIPGTGIGGLLGQIAGSPPACSDNGSQTARLRLVRSKIFRAPSSVRRASDTEPRKASASVEEPYCLETGCLRPSRAAAVSTPTKLVLRLEHQRDVSEIEPPRRFKKRGKQLWQTRFEFCIGHAVAYEAIEIMCGDRSEIVRASHAPGEPDGVEEERTLPEGCLFTREDLRLKKLAELGRVLIAAEQVAAA